MSAESGISMLDETPAAEAAREVARREMTGEPCDSN